MLCLSNRSEKSKLDRTNLPDSVFLHFNACKSEPVRFDIKQFWFRMHKSLDYLSLDHIPVTKAA
jgi:hypothetical protein